MLHFTNRKSIQNIMEVDKNPMPEFKPFALIERLRKFGKVLFYQFQHETPSEHFTHPFDDELAQERLQQYWQGILDWPESKTNED